MIRRGEVSSPRVGVDLSILTGDDTSPLRLDSYLSGQFIEVRATRRVARTNGQMETIRRRKVSSPRMGVGLSNLAGEETLR